MKPKVGDKVEVTQKRGLARPIIIHGIIKEIDPRSGGRYTIIKGKAEEFIVRKQAVKVIRKS